MRQTLKKHERLHGKKTIDALFSQGQSFFSHPFIIYRKIVPVSVGSAPVCAVLFSVGKKKFPHAVQRNLLKRKMKEVFRKNKHLLYPPATSRHCNLHLAFVYIKNDILDYATIEKKMVETFGHLLVEMEKEKLLDF
jgi:ribonuclease P protein component